jgi:heptosyltransferase I
MKYAFLFMPYNPGDVLMALYVARDFKQQNPDWSLDFIVGDDALGLVQNWPWLAEVIPLPRKQLQQARLDGHPPEALIALVKESLKPLKERKYDLGINLFQGTFGAYLASYLDARQKVGLWVEPGAGFRVHTHWMTLLMALPVERDALPLHVIDFYRLAIQEALQSDAGNSKADGIETPNLAALHSLVDQGTTATAKSDFPHCALHPGSAWPGKRWPIKNWVELSTVLLKAGWTVSITGSPEEKSLERAWPATLQAAYPETLKLCIGNTHWQDLRDLFARQLWVITGDTVAMHLGAALGRQVLALFGASNPSETGPYGDGHFIMECESGSYPSELLLNQQHSGLEALPVSVVSDFILLGKMPVTTPDSSTPRYRLWETYSLPSSQRQGLRDPKGHPRRPTPTLTTTTKENLSPFLHPELSNLIAALDRAISHRTPESLRELEKVEALWGATTAHSLIWESYRIGINGLTLYPLTKHLACRKQLLENTLKTELPK